MLLAAVEFDARAAVVHQLRDGARAVSPVVHARAEREVKLVVVVLVVVVVVVPVGGGVRGDAWPLPGVHQVVLGERVEWERAEERSRLGERLAAAEPANHPRDNRRLPRLAIAREAAQLREGAAAQPRRGGGGAEETRGGEAQSRLEQRVAQRAAVGAEHRGARGDYRESRGEQIASQHEPQPRQPSPRAAPHRRVAVGMVLAVMATAREAPLVQLPGGGEAGEGGEPQRGERHEARGERVIARPPQPRRRHRLVAADGEHAQGYHVAEAVDEVGVRRQHREQNDAAADGHEGHPSEDVAEADGERHVARGEP